MDIKAILSKVDHTLLRPDSTWDEIRALCDDALAFGTATVCIPASFVQQAAEHLAGRLPVCTVVGFPNGYSTTQAKCFEATQAVASGAAEIDMVINVGWVKEGRYCDVLREIQQVKAACHGRTLKVIIETCMLTDAEKKEMCRVVSESGADFIKTSTGFGKGGATFDDVALMAANVAPHVRIKAAGGIATLEDAQRFIELGASRLGTSRVVALARKAGI